MSLQKASRRGTNPVWANSERIGGYSFSGVRRGVVSVFCTGMRKGRDTGSLYPAPCGCLAHSELFNLGRLLFVEVTHLRQVFTAGCGVQACFIRTLRQLGKLAVVALVVNHADADRCEEED